MEFELTKRQIKAFLAIIPKNETRDWLMSLHCLVRDGWINLEASDGCHAVRVRLGQCGASYDVLIKRADLEMVSKMKGPQFSFEVCDKSIIVKDAHQTVTITPFGRSFPLLDGVIPKQVSGEYAAYNPKFAVNIIEVFAAMEGVNADVYVTNVYANGRDATVIKPKSSSPLRAVGLVMPLRDGLELEAY